ncbi:MAG TPA: alpha/beta hydrolase [Candidatus Melainabacteria bacterium]|nr:alpha/beta hydrolase [Candidatus Melainabacteria bacterium]HIN63580.1 alpha/beta hydrolase [Candidatus Obscuribacterales bacterium]
MTDVSSESKQLRIADSNVELYGISLKVRKLETDSPRATIVFLHDSLGCIPVWRDFPERLCGLTRCNGIIYDRQGYGGSGPFTRERDQRYLEREADALAALMKKLGLSKSILFGHSDGGSIALVAAAKTPELISGVITEGAHVFVEEITLEGIRHAQKLFKETDLRQRITKYHGDNTDGVISAWIDTWLSPEFRDFNMEHLLPSIKCPVLVLQGEGDEYGSEAQVDAIVNQVSGTSLKDMVKFARHTPHKEAPEYTLRVTANFVTSLNSIVNP